MMVMRKIFDSQRRHFVPGGKLERYYPIFEATETVFFVPGDVTRAGPHVRDSLDIKRFMVAVIITLFPPLLFGIYNTGFHARTASGLSLDFGSVFLSGLYLVLPIEVL